LKEILKTYVKILKDVARNNVGDNKIVGLYKEIEDGFDEIPNSFRS
jgi:hypothetical protein